MSSINYDLREYQETDLTSLANIYRSSIRHLGVEYYSKDQVAAWSSFPDDEEEFEKWVKEAKTFIAVGADNACIGFGGLQDHGRISSLFVAPGFMRKGIGSRLLERLLEEARSREFALVTTEASEFSKPLFEKHGFKVADVELTEFRGVKFSRYAMQTCI